MTEVHHERRTDVALLTLNRPVANALAPALRAELLKELNAALSDETVRAVVLAGAGADFSTGVDITEYGQDLGEPWVSDLCLAIENAGKPVVAALHGAVLGGGLDLALAAHARVASQETRVGLPEVQLGLIPNGGATQRLPRLVGADVAADLMLSGGSRKISDPALEGLVDEVTSGSVVEAGLAKARQLADAGEWVRTGARRTGLMEPLAFQNTVAELRRKWRDKRSAEAEILTCLEAALLLPYAQGLKLETALFRERRHTQDARARRHFHVAEKRAMIMPERATGHARDVTEVVVPGDGGLVTELVIACLDYGFRVSILAQDVAATEALQSRIEKIYHDAILNKAISSEAGQSALSRLTSAWPDQALARADMVLDTGQIDLSAHAASLNPHAIWAGVMDQDAIPAPPPVGIDSSHVGVRVYRPALRIRVVELFVTRGASADTVVTTAQFFNRLGRTAIRCECVDGMVGGNMSAALFSAALALAKAGVGPYRIDAAARGLGFARGPFRLMDDEGLKHVAKRLERRKLAGGASDSGVLAPRIADGATGQRAGRGFYIYDDAGAHYDPELKDTASGVLPAMQADPRAGLQAALANEAARLLSAGVVQRASDIDVVMVRAFGFNLERGGPLFQADLSGALSVLNSLKLLAPLSEVLWQPHETIEDMVKNGTGFFGRPGRDAA